VSSGSCVHDFAVPQAGAFCESVNARCHRGASPRGESRRNPERRDTYVRPQRVSTLVDASVSIRTRRLAAGRKTLTPARPQIIAIGGSQASLQRG
jgi:hypothetical protein